jgi:hypothetical protein
MAKRGLQMSLKGGRPLTGPALLDVFGPHLQRAALTLQAGIQKASPVKTGTLRRSWTTSQPREGGTGVYVMIGTAIVYARYQNTRTINRGYVERGVETSMQEALRVFREGIGSDIGQLWVSK